MKQISIYYEVLLKHKIWMLIIIKGIEVYSKSCTKYLIHTFSDLVQTKGRIRWSMDTNHDSYLSLQVSEPLCLWTAVSGEFEQQSAIVFMSNVLAFHLGSCCRKQDIEPVSPLVWSIRFLVFWCLKEVEVYYRKKVN